MQLLDRAMMAPEQPAADCMSAAAPACLYLAVCQDNQHSRDALPLLSGFSNLTGVEFFQATQPETSPKPLRDCLHGFAGNIICCSSLLVVEDFCLFQK